MFPNLVARTNFLQPLRLGVYEFLVLTAIFDRLLVKLPRHGCGCSGMRLPFNVYVRHSTRERHIERRRRRLLGLRCGLLGDDRFADHADKPNPQAEDKHSHGMSL